MTMRRSPRRPLILRRRKLPFQNNDRPATESESQADASGFREPSKSARQCFPDGIRIMDHPSMSDTQVVVISKTADLQSVIGALTAKGKECGVQGPNKFILLSENSSCDDESFCQPSAGGDGISTATLKPVKAETVHSSPDAKPLTGIKALNKELECGPLDDSLTNIQWLGRMNTCAFESDTAKVNKENQNPNSQTFQEPNTQIDAEAVQQPMSERPPYSYMAMIQFAINSRKSRRMTLKEIYMWIEDHFPYFREVAKPGWKNSIRHNLSLHDMFIRETSPDGKISFWTIRPEANRCLTLDQVYKQQKRMLPDARKTPTSSERRMKPLLPRTDSYLVPIQLPVTSSVYLPSSSAPFHPSSSQQQKRNTLRGAKRVRIAPKVTQGDAPAAVMYPQKNKDLKVKEEPVCVPIKCETLKAPPKRQASGSRRKQHLVHSVHEEPVLLCPDNTFFDSGVASDASAFQDMRDTELEEHQQEQHGTSTDRDFSFKTPIKSNSHLSSSTPSKPPHVLPEPWKVTPVGKGSQEVLDFSPIRTPGGPAVTPRHDYTTFSFNNTPFKDWPLFSSPRELLTSAPPRVPGLTDSPRSSCSRELLRAGGAATPANRSITEGLVLDTMNDSLSKILVDISFSGLDDEDLGMTNISWSEFIPQFK
ncbi:forkhead box protein M1 isoform X2 [Etheostoma cragini]|uniref:forkhead box protein M1 isoform X2 n=1 Tax=Etheostoma cragini TaxID=417921 RepID=UPI00155EC897|nr:forkhead box protein M1 isoform X2 [Etheostoma cragini]